MKGALNFSRRLLIQLWIDPDFSGDAVTDVTAAQVRDGVGCDGGDLRAGGQDADKVHRIGGRNYNRYGRGMRRPYIVLPPRLTQQIHHLRQRELLARDAGDEPSAANFASRFHPTQDRQKFLPGRRGVLAREQITEEDAVTG